MEGEKKHPYAFTEEKNTQNHEVLFKVKTPTVPQAAPCAMNFQGLEAVWRMPWKRPEWRWLQMAPDGEGAPPPLPPSKGKSGWGWILQCWMAAVISSMRF